MEQQKQKIEQKKKELLDKLVSNYKHIIEDYANFKGIIVKEGVQEFKELVETSFLWKEEDINKYYSNFEQLEQDLIEYINSLTERYLGLDITKVDLRDGKVYFNLVTAFGGPTEWIELVYNANTNSIEFNSENLDLDTVNIFDYILISEHESILIMTLYYDLKQQYEELAEKMDF